jgi:hypothetical protein
MPLPFVDTSHFGDCSLVVSQTSNRAATYGSFENAGLYVRVFCAATVVPSIRAPCRDHELYEEIGPSGRSKNKKLIVDHPVAHHNGLLQVDNVGVFDGERLVWK